MLSRFLCSCAALSAVAPLLVPLVPLVFPQRNCRWFTFIETLPGPACVSDVRRRLLSCVFNCSLLHFHTSDPAAVIVFFESAFH